MVGIEYNEFERYSIATPSTYVVVGPVSVMEIHFGEHILCKAIDIEFAFNLFVILVVFACKVSACNGTHHLGEFCRGGPIGAACGPTVLAIASFATVLDHVDGFGINAVICFDKTSVQSFAQVVDAEVFAVVEHDHLQTALVIDFGTFHEGGHHGIADIVRPEAVAVVAQVETLDFLSFGARLEERVFQYLVAVVVVVHLDGDTLLGLVAAPVADDGNSCIDFPCFFGGGTAFFEIFHVRGELCIFPEVGSLAGFRAFGVVVVGYVATATHIPHAASTAREIACGIETVSGIEHVFVIDCNGYDRHRYAFVDEVGLCRGIDSLSVHEFGTANDRVCGDLLCGGNLFRTCRGERTVECAVDLAAIFRGKRFNGQILVEARFREY